MIGSGYGMGWGWLFGLLMLLGLVLLVVVAVRALGGGIWRDTSARDIGPGAGESHQPARTRAREILDERYARGELNTDEYRDRLEALGEDT